MRPKTGLGGEGVGLEAYGLKTPRGVPRPLENHALEGSKVAATPAFTSGVGTVEAVLTSARGRIISLPEAVADGRGLGRVAVLFSIPVPVVGATPRATAPEGHPLTKAAPTGAPASGA